jgi:exopolysaccharide biosynthesis polyprenyl glycosylphosphotransferase
MKINKAYSKTQRGLVGIQFVGDGFVAFGGLSLAYFLRFHSPLRKVGVEPWGITYWEYFPPLLLGALFFLGSYAYLDLYNPRLLLRPLRSISICIKAIAFWFAAFVAISFVLKFSPTVSRFFILISCLTVFVLQSTWRTIFHYWLFRSKYRERIIQKVLLVGWTDESEQFSRAIEADRGHAYLIVGYLCTASTDDKSVYPVPCIGTIDQLEEAVSRHHVDIVVVADPHLDQDRLMHISAICERLYLQFKITPTFFRIFISNLRLQTISGVPVLGVEDLPISSLINAASKRALDLVGAIVGLFLSVPIIALFALLIKRESPGPIFYTQVRTGRHGKPFYIYKLRSMKSDAEKEGAQWAVKDDPRRTAIGTFMRSSNIDELPQFWNVLKGDMSLVGPRPERPELIARFEREIPHYNPRHEARPGITGWAQVNGLRGNTSLVERIRYDLYYLENWSIRFDIQIMILTFRRQKNAY